MVGLRTAVGALIAALLTGAGTLVTGADASMLEISTSTPAPSRDGGQRAMEQAVRAAVETVLKETTAFTPTTVVLTRAVVIGDRLYLRLLLTDEDAPRPLPDSSSRENGVPADPRGRDLRL